MIRTYTNDDILICKSKIDNDKQNEMYRKKLPNANYEFPYEDFINLTVRGYTRENINLKTYCNYKNNTKPTATIVMIHGIGGSSKNQAHVADSFANAGYFAASVDMRTFGRSDYDIGYAKNFDDFINDLVLFTNSTSNYVKKTFGKELPIFIIGSSMGGLVAHYLSKHIEVRGVIYVAPAFDVPLSCFIKGIVSTMACLCPSTHTPKSKPVDNVSSKNPEYGEYEYTNPMIQERYSNFGNVNALLRKIDQFKREQSTQSIQSSSHEKAMLMIVAGVEKIVCLDAILGYFESSLVLDKDIWLYPNAWHFLYMEEEIYDILPRLNKWIEDRLS